MSTTNENRAVVLPRSCSPPVVCGAVGYMDKLGYGGFFAEGDKRRLQGDEQTYCSNCQLAMWPEEQRTCPHFKRSEELEQFYASEANAKEMAPPLTGGVETGKES